MSENYLELVHFYVNARTGCSMIICDLFLSNNPGNKLAWGSSPKNGRAGDCWHVEELWPLPPCLPDGAVDLSHEPAKSRLWALFLEWESSDPAASPGGAC